MKLIKYIILSSEIEIININNKPSLIIHSITKELYLNDKCIPKLIKKIDDIINTNRDKLNIYKTLF